VVHVALTLILSIAPRILPKPKAQQQIAPPALIHAVAPSGFGDLSALILHTGLPFSETDNGRYSAQGLLKPLRTVCPSTVVLSVQKCARMFPIRVSFGAGDAQQLRFGSASRHQTWGRVSAAVWENAEIG
jgi:hypothetical protein